MLFLLYDNSTAFTILEKLATSSHEDFVSVIAAPVLYFTISVEGVEVGSKILEGLYRKFPQLSKHQNVVLKLMELRICSAINTPANSDKVQQILSWIEQKVDISDPQNAKLVSQAYSACIDTMIDIKDFDGAKISLENYKKYLTPRNYKLYNALLKDAGQFEDDVTTPAAASAPSGTSGEQEVSQHILKASKTSDAPLGAESCKAPTRYLSPERIAMIEGILSASDAEDLAEIVYRQL